MIKIIKEGKITRFKKTCPDCGCEFEYETSDLITDYSVCLTTSPSQYSTYVICPCCGKHIHHGVTSVANLMNITLCKNTIDCTSTGYAKEYQKLNKGDK